MAIVNADRRTTSVTEFQELILAFAQMASREGVTVVPYEGDAPKHFPLLPESLQLAVVQHFRDYVHVASEVLEHGGALRDDQIFLWRFLRRLRFHPPSNLMDAMAEGEIIEVHDRNLVQIFRNLRFFELCSYTLDDLLCRPFFELLERDNKITEYLLEQVDALFKSAPRTIQHMAVDEHTVVEKESSHRLVLRVRQRLMAPLRGTVGGEVVAIATFIPARLDRPQATPPNLPSPADWFRIDSLNR